MQTPKWTFLGYGEESPVNGGPHVIIEFATMDQARAFFDALPTRDAEIRREAVAAAAEVFNRHAVGTTGIAREVVAAIRTSAAALAAVRPCNIGDDHE